MLDVLLDSEARIEEAGVDLPVFIAAGNGHTTILAGDFDELEEGEVRQVNWLTKFLNSEPSDDLKCAECGSPSD